MATHCWEGGPIDPEDGMSRTCMAEDGHAGPHQWVRDNEIIISFPPYDDDAKDHVGHTDDF